MGELANTVRSMVKEFTVFNWLTILAFAMSSLTWIRTIMRDRFSINLLIMDYNNLSPAPQFFVLIENKSSTPVSITTIFIGPEKERCKLESVKISRKTDFTGDNIADQVTNRSAEFPIYLQGLGAQYCYLELESTLKTELVAGAELSFCIHTSRGKTNKTLILPSADRFFPRHKTRAL